MKTATIVGAGLVGSLWAVYLEKAGYQVKIFELRDEVAELQSISELKNIEGFPLDKYEQLMLYLTLK